MLHAANHNASGSRSIPNRNGVSASRLSLIRHDAVGLREFEGIDGFSDVVVPFPGSAAVGQFRDPGAAVIVNEVLLTGSINPSVYLIGQVRVA